MAMTNSQDLFEKSQKVIPGGVNSPVRAFGSVGRTPVFMKKAKGSHIFDEDGNSYVDYVCSWGPGILGHADDRVIDAVKAACDDGLTFGAPTRKELEIAELTLAEIPGLVFLCEFFLGFSRCFAEIELLELAAVCFLEGSHGHLFL